MLCHIDCRASIVTSAAVQSAYARSRLGADPTERDDVGVGEA